MRRCRRKALKLLTAILLLCVVYLKLFFMDAVLTPSYNEWERDVRREWSSPHFLFAGHQMDASDLIRKSRRENRTEAKSFPKDAFVSARSSFNVDRTTQIYPTNEKHADDRILNQMRFVSEDLVRKMQRGETIPPKRILIYNSDRINIPRGQALFKEQRCRVQDCEILLDKKQLVEADVVLFSDDPGFPDVSSRPSHQIWVLSLLESPYHTRSFQSRQSLFNWTATYRHDSTIVTPYEKFVPLNSSLLTRKPSKNYAAGKTKLVAWFVSNCVTRNNRFEYAKELSKYIQVDIYGECGQLKCTRYRKGKCFDMLNTDYKFYLSFENSNCRDYITEKFFINGLKHDVVPIVMGAAPEDYERAAPPHSYIHVDDFRSPKDLADYLHKLDQDDSLYNQYFAWKGLWDNINTHFWCRMCALAHDTKSRGFSWYSDVDTWWRGFGVCVDDRRWRDAVSAGEGTADLAVWLPER